MNDIKELLRYNEMESKVFMPNEIFEDLKQSDIKPVHIPFAYSYYYLINWLYRYTKYYETRINNKQIKEILGYHPDQKTIDYILKKNGVLDQIGYTQTVKDFPVMWELDKFEGLKFIMLSDMDGFTQQDIKKHLSRKYSIKYPVKAFVREYDDEGNIDEEGTFYNIMNTHCVPFEVFIFSMQNDKLGCTAFYLYSYIKMMNDKFLGGWDISIRQMVKDTGVSKKTLERYLDQLNKHKMIETIHNMEYFCLATQPEERKSNTYIVNEFDKFLVEPQTYQKLKVIRSSEYYKMRDEKFENLFGGKIDIPLEKLPF
ncbi:hypothetical protein [Rummeliibacillus suwonensis]|uniref:hypothetical protein n=1 Tax=Rummeliibacillus suwonensis TaxID=1306154 RepID=UPI0011B42ED8|nr:hypothetical protein [Rummeliibacillus suwonensis]